MSRPAYVTANDHALYIADINDRCILRVKVSPPFKVRSDCFTSARKQIMLRCSGVIRSVGWAGPSF